MLDVSWGNRVDDASGSCHRHDVSRDASSDITGSGRGPVGPSCGPESSRLNNLMALPGSGARKPTERRVAPTPLWSPRRCPSRHGAKRDHRWTRGRILRLRRYRRSRRRPDHGQQLVCHRHFRQGQPGRPFRSAPAGGARQSAHRRADSRSNGSPCPVPVGSAGSVLLPLRRRVPHGKSAPRRLHPDRAASRLIRIPTGSSPKWPTLTCVLVHSRRNQRAIRSPAS